MLGVYNHLLRKVFRFHYHSQKVIGSLGICLVCFRGLDKEGTDLLCKSKNPLINAGKIPTHFHRIEIYKYVHLVHPAICAYPPKTRLISSFFVQEMVTRLLEYTLIGYTWMFPKIGVKPPKWMVNFMVPNPMNKWMIWGAHSPYSWFNTHMKISLLLPHRIPWDPFSPEDPPRISLTARFRVHDYRNIAAFSVQHPHTVRDVEMWC